jgi:hypothetical protein
VSNRFALLRIKTCKEIHETKGRGSAFRIASDGKLFARTLMLRFSCRQTRFWT